MPSEKSVWLASSQLGFKRVVFLVTIGITAILIAKLFSSTVAIVALAYFVLFLFVLLRELLFAGVYMRLKVFSVGKITYELRDFLMPMKPSENLRGIYVMSTGAISSRLYLRANQRWAYFDKLREFLEQQYIPLQSFLLLGGGGGTVAVTLARTYPQAQIDVVEISRQFSHLAKHYFLPLLREKNQVSWFTNSAQKFIQRKEKQYNAVFIDIFEGEKIPNSITTERFLRSAKRRVAPKGVIVFNLGIQAKNDLAPFLNRLITIFQALELYWWERNLVAVWHAPALKKHE